MIQREFRIIFIRSPSLYFASGFEYCPYETIQIIHNNTPHWILLSSFNREFKIFDILNTQPAIETLQQIKQFFLHTAHFHSTSYHTMSQTSWNHRLRLFAIAYSNDIAFGNNPSEIVYDQSKLPQHLGKCKVKYNDTTTTGSITSEDQHKELIRRLSAHHLNDLKTLFQLK